MPHNFTCKICLSNFKNLLSLDKVFAARIWVYITKLIVKLNLLLHFFDRYFLLNEMIWKKAKY